jgi:hypothetical protein
MDEYKRFFAMCEKEMSQEETIRKLIKTLQILDCQVVRIENTYRVDPDRYGVNLVLRRDTDKHYLKAGVDLKHGKPTWNQLMDVTFGAGESSDLKIIVFDGQDNEWDDLDDSADEHLAECFAKVVNSCGGDSYLLKLDTASDRGANFTPLLMPAKDRKLVYKELPSRPDFERAQFWVLYHSQRFPEPKAITADPDFWFRDYSSVESKKVKAITRWDDEGICLEATFKTSLQAKDFRRRFEAKFGNAWGNYQACKIRVRSEGEFEKRLTANLSDIPVRHFVLASESEKRELTDFYQLAEQEIPYFIDMVLRDTKTENRRTKYRVQKAQKVPVRIPFNKSKKEEQSHGK